MGSTPTAGIGGPEEDGAFLESAFVVADASALVGSKNPLGVIQDEDEEIGAADHITTYTVRPGDAPSAIATKFGISLNTLLWANQLKNANFIKPGDELIILPVTGVRYTIAKGDTLGGIARRFRGDIEEIASFNGMAADEPLRAGDVIIIPDGELPAVSSGSPRRAASAPRPSATVEIEGYYQRPILGGRRSRGLHGYNGVDLAQPCGQPVFASAGGKVIIARQSGWNGGYGKYAVISHPNNTQTLYGHLSALYPGVGQDVERGAIIGAVGSTGNSTGCHMHFEIRGAKNPF
ncbi:MAG: peptidoglycan DD-metalloendopeptidase family protein [Patescibacteria group bacterium]